MPTIIDGTTGVDNIKTGSVEVQDISATGTPSSSTFLRGDGSWQSPAGGVTSLNGETGAITNTALNAIGSWGFLCPSTNQSGVYANPGDTKAGSGLRFAGINNGGLRVSTTAGTGTWRCMGYAEADSSQPVTVFCRIS